MECSLGNNLDLDTVDSYGCLNPYSNGMLTWVCPTPGSQLALQLVLILILMECSLGLIQ